MGIKTLALFFFLKKKKEGSYTNELEEREDQLKTTSQTRTFIYRLEHLVVRQINLIGFIMQCVEVVVKPGKANDVKSRSRDPMGDIDDGTGGKVERL